MNPTTNYSGPVLIIGDTFIAGRHVQAGRVIAVKSNEYSLLREANRCEVFNPEDKAHQEAHAASKVLDNAEAAAAKAAAAEAEKEQDKAPGSSPAAIKAAENAKKNVAALSAKKAA